jgi:4-alpha-glucanotransferase
MGRGPAEAWGIAAGFHGTDGGWRATSPETLAALLDAMGAGPEGPPQPSDLPVVVTLGATSRVPEPELVTEDGAKLRLDGALPADLPLGYHRLVGPSRERRLVVAPPRCRLPDDLFGWGMTAQLYSVVSRRSLGLGDLGDLRTMGEWASELGATFLLLNPLGAALPGLPQEPSPYYASSRRFLNPLYLRVDGVPPAAARRARQGELIDRDAIYSAKLGALEQQWERERDSVRTSLARFRRERAGLEEYATFCALTEVHGRPWRSWPEAVRRPGSAQVARFARERRDRVRFHEWLQWRLDQQVTEAARPCGLLNDVPVGFHPDGADAWAWQGSLAQGVSVGAPPDTFNQAGQDWGLPPFDPWRLAADGFEPFVQTLRAAFRHAAGIRLDHVMALFRLYWIPLGGGGPEQGAYVRYPARALLDILALESVRAGAYVVGEDLGTVEDGVRRELRDRGVLSYRLVWFEPDSPEAFPVEAVAALTTHDLPTLLGIWEEVDPMPDVRARLVAMTRLSASASEDEVIEEGYRVLARAPSRLVALTLEDLAGARERPNRPGTTAPSNWTRRLPLTLEQLRRSRRGRLLASILARDVARRA